jgi:hypothetical protein
MTLHKNYINLQRVLQRFLGITSAFARSPHLKASSKQNNDENNK